MKKIVFLLLCTLVSLTSYAQFANKISDRKTEADRYDIECAGNGERGTYLVKVSTYSRNRKIAINQTVKNAVRGVIFKGYGGGDGCVAQRPLTSNPEAEAPYAEFFEEFFQNDGAYSRYASVVDGTLEVTKLTRLWKVSQVVTVRKDDLRKYLEQKGVIKGLDSMF